MERRATEPKRILLIAGSDSSGGAGLEADQKVTAAHGCYAMAATTALTAQNTLGVSAIHHVPSEFVVNQIDLCIDDIGVDVVKIGMLASASTVNAVAAALDRHERPTTILDPVMVSTSGAQLLPNDAVSNLIMHLLPIATVLTPNVPEAKLLLEHAGIPVPSISSLEGLIHLATLIQGLGPKNVLVKGGHFPLPSPKSISAASRSAKVATDVLVTSEPHALKSKVTIYQTDYIASKNTHGTGCSLASAIACNIALGHDIPAAVANSVRYIESAIKAAVDWRLGGGSGPIDHFSALRRKVDGGAAEEEMEGSTMVMWEFGGQGEGDGGGDQ